MCNTHEHKWFSDSQWLFDDLNAEFGFTLDVAARPNNAKCAADFTEADDGLAQPWEGGYAG